MPKPPKLYWVRWADSHYDTGWEFADSYKMHPTDVCESVGWLIGSSRDEICLAQSVSHLGSANFHHHARMCIPKRAIIEKREIVD
jgi:hypothetical protein